MTCCVPNANRFELTPPGRAPRRPEPPAEPAPWTKRRGSGPGAAPGRQAAVKAHRGRRCDARRRPPAARRASEPGARSTAPTPTTVSPSSISAVAQMTRRRRGSKRTRRASSSCVGLGRWRASRSAIPPASRGGPGAGTPAGRGADAYERASKRPGSKPSSHFLQGSSFTRPATAIRTLGSRPAAGPPDLVQALAQRRLGLVGLVEARARSRRRASAPGARCGRDGGGGCRSCGRCGWRSADAPGGGAAPRSRM